MNKHKPKTYLAGGMEKDKDLGAGWRDQLTPFLDSLGFDVHDPVKFEAEKLKNFKVNRLPETFETRSGEIKPCNHWHTLKEASDTRLFNRFLRYMRQIIRYDLKVVNEMDLIIVHWSQATSKGAGTSSELTEAFIKNIPIYCVESHVMPAWATACCTEIFNNFEELKEFLREEYEQQL